MKTVALENANLATCVHKAQRDRVLLTKHGAPIAVLISMAGLDREQIALGSSPEFWRLIAERRRQPTISRAELDARLKTKKRRTPKQN